MATIALLFPLRWGMTSRLGDITEVLSSQNSKLSDEFYGRGRHGLPYQSIYHDGEELVAGRRQDIDDRLDKLDDRDLAGKDVIDFGSNIGSSAFLAAERGATVTGVEYDPALGTSALRINTMFGHPCEFVQGDLSSPVDLGGEFDTGFCFSIDKHVDNDEQLAEIIDTHVGETLYFETHANSEIPTR